MTTMRQIPLAIGPEPLPTFNSFVVGANAAALDYLQALSNASANPSPPPVYLWGPPGSGKTHLLRALAYRLQQTGARVGWFAAGDPAPWAWVKGWSLIVIDDCAELDEVAQQAAFALLVDATTEGVQLVAAGSVPPVDLPLREDLRTRLAWGHVFAMQALAEAETRAALRREADRRGIFLSDEVMDFLLTRYPRDLRHLMRTLDQLDQFALARSRPVTVPLVKLMMQEQVAP